MALLHQPFIKLLRQAYRVFLDTRDADLFKIGKACL